MGYHAQVTAAAQSLGLLNAAGELIALDSLAVADFVVALEDSVGTRIPMLALTEQAFSSIDSVARMLEDVVTAA